MMRTRIQTGALALVASLAMSGAVLGAEPATVTGKVTDSMCGAKHMMADDEAGCTRACVKKGASYALVVKDKVYRLETSDAAVKSDLDKLAGQVADITGEVHGDTIRVTSVGKK